MTVPIYQVLSPVDCNRGGITRSCLKRARLLAARFDQQVHVLSFHFNPDYEITQSELRAIGLINARVSVRNFFEDMADECLKRQGPRPSSAQVHAASEPVNRTSSGVTRSEIVSPQGMLTHVHHHDGEDRLVVVEHFDTSGRLRRIDHRDPRFDAVTESVFLLGDGRPFLSVSYDPETEECEAASLLDLDSPTTVVRSYPGLTEMIVEWLQTYADRQEASVFFSDYRNTDELVMRLDRERVAWVKTLHTNHLARPFVYGAPLRPRAKIELGNAGSFDALVLLSERQRADVMRQFGPRGTYHVVNNPAPEPSDPPGVERDMLRAVGVGRYHALKRWDYAITAFRTVVDRVPGARLELWGFGPAQSDLQDLIGELGLEEHVFLRGATADSASVFAGAAFSVLSSPAEGFPLVPLESMAVGTPVVAFNVNYGLEDQITSGVDGMLVDAADTDALAAAMVELFTDADRCRAMGREARKVTARLSEPAYVEAWVRVIESALEQRSHRVEIARADAMIDSARFTSGGRLSVEGRIEFDSVPADLGVSLFLRTRARDDDRYYAVDSLSQGQGDTVCFKVSVAADELVAPDAVWDFYVSCSARNAHRLARVHVADDVRLGQRRVGALVLRPYRTSGGNMSAKVVPYRSLAQRAVGRVSTALGR